MNARDFGHRLGEVLEASGFSKLQFSRQLQARRHAREARGEPPLRKVDRPALYAFLDGRDVPPLDTVAEMAEMLRVRLGWLAEGEERMEQGLPDGLPPVWLIDGRNLPLSRLGVSERLQSRRIFQEAFLGRSEGFHEAEPAVRVVFKELLARRLARRRAKGERATFDPA